MVFFPRPATKCVQAALKKKTWKNQGKSTCSMYQRTKKEQIMQTRLPPAIEPGLPENFIMEKQIHLRKNQISDSMCVYLCVCVFLYIILLPAKKNSPHSPLLQWNLCFSLAVHSTTHAVTLLPSRERKKISHQIGKERSSSQLHFLISLDGICYVPGRVGIHCFQPLSPKISESPSSRSCKKTKCVPSLGEKNTQAFQRFQPNYQWLETKQITNLVGG